MEDNTTDENAKVKIYSTPLCSYCKIAKDWLGQQNIPFKDIDVAEDQEAAKHMVEKTDQLSVPVFEIDGRFIVGFKKNELQEALGIKE